MGVALQIVFAALQTISVLWFCRYLSLRRRSKGLAYPPGPKGSPVIGNLFDIPAQPYDLLSKALEWQKTYGDVVFVDAFGQGIMFLNSYEAAVRILDKRSTVFSSRPVSVMQFELQEWNFSFPALPYGHEWNKGRTVFRKHMDGQALIDYQEIQAQSACRFVESLCDHPEDFYQNARMCIGSMVMMISYGHEVTSMEDPYVALAEKAIAAGTGVTPGRYLVDAIPLLKYIPEWVPGAAFQTVAREGRNLSRSVRNDLYHVTKAKIAAGTATPCIATELLEEMSGPNEQNLDEDLISGIASTSYLAGIDTTTALLNSFILIMMHHPAVQRRAQDELDRVVGLERLPTFDDRKKLLYLEAVYKECLRWQPVAPLGVPHSSSEDDHSQGYFIPKGTILMANAWAMLHDSVEYPNPSVFDPERHLSKYGWPAARDPGQILFGFGRRVCPGEHFAQASLFIVMATVLAAFYVKKPEGDADACGDDRGNGRFVEAFVRRPKPFACVFEPRSKEKVALLKELSSAHEQAI